MTRFDELNERFINTQRAINDLIADYADKKKGDIYATRYGQLITKLDEIKDQIFQLGSSGSVYFITGHFERTNPKNKITIYKKFELCLANVHPDDVMKIIRVRVPKVVSYNIKQVKPGQIIIK